MSTPLSAASVQRKKWNVRTYWFYGFVLLILAFIAGGLYYMVHVGGGTLPVAGQAPPFVAKDDQGKTFAMKDESGKLVLVTWFYTHCTDECPLTMFRMEQIQEQLKAKGWFGSKVVLVSMTIDPSRDTQSVLVQYGQHFRADSSGWYLIRTNESDTRKILKQWGIQEQSASDKEFLEHTLKTELIDQNGNIRQTYNTANLDVTQVMKDITGLEQRMSWS